ncbi:MAG: nucleotidyltransferase family protein [Bacteroidia bacterium]
MLTDCIILAGGLGTRLQKLISDIPKVMAPVNGKPFLSYQLKHLQKHNITKFIFSVGYKKEMIIDYCLKNENTWQLIFAEEDEPLGTGGGIKNALQHSDAENILVINGDSFFNIPYKNLYLEHLKKNALCTVALKPLKNYDRYGSVEINPDNRITAFTEKQFQKTGYINAGVYVLNRKEFEKLNLPDKFSFEKDFLEKYFHSHPIYGFSFDEYFIDIGIPEDYNRAQDDFLKLFGA